MLPQDNGYAGKSGIGPASDSGGEEQNRDDCGGGDEEIRVEGLRRCAGCCEGHECQDARALAGLPLYRRISSTLIRDERPGLAATQMTCLPLATGTKAPTDRHAGRHRTLLSW